MIDDTAERRTSTNALCLWFLQLELWKRVITFEKSNPLRSEDTALVTRRVMFATEQCLLVLTHHPAVWHQAAQYLDQSAKLLTEKGVRKFVVVATWRPATTTHRRQMHWNVDEYSCRAMLRRLLDRWSLPEHTLCVRLLSFHICHATSASLAVVETLTVIR